MQYSDTRAKLKKNLKMIVFDLDGTIANTNDLVLFCFTQLFGHRKKYYTKYMGPPSKIVIQKLFKKISKKQIKIYNHIWMDLYYEKLRKGSWISKKTINTLRKLKKKYVLGIISSSSMKTALIILKNNAKLFDFIICAEQQKKYKPNPDSLKKIIKKYKLKPKNIAYVGDNIIDIIFGKNAKIKTVGKIDLLYCEKQLKKYKPDFMIKNISELECLL